jgi:hypothetical protein
LDKDNELQKLVHERRLLLAELKMKEEKLKIETEEKEKNRRKPKEAASGTSKGEEDAKQAKEKGKEAAAGTSEPSRSEMELSAIKPRSIDFNLQRKDIQERAQEAKESEEKMKKAQEEAENIMRGKAKTAFEENADKRLKILEEKVMKDAKENEARDKILRQQKIDLEVQVEKTTQMQKQSWKQMISNWQKEFIFTGFATEFDNNDKTRNIQTILMNFAKEENLQVSDAGPPPVITTHTKEQSRRVEGEQNQGYQYPSVRFGTEEAGRRFAQWISAKHCEGIGGGIHKAILRSGEEAQAK